MSEQRLKITQVRSLIGHPRTQRDAMRSLGLRRIRHSVIHPDRPEIRGLARQVHHLVTVEEIPAEAATEGAKE